MFIRFILSVFSHWSFFSSCSVYTVSVLADQTQDHRHVLKFSVCLISSLFFQLSLFTHFTLFFQSCSNNCGHLYCSMHKIFVLHFQFKRWHCNSVPNNVFYSWKGMMSAYSTVCMSTQVHFDISCLVGTESCWEIQKWLVLEMSVPQNNVPFVIV